ncbi:MAG TPA: tRNA epoxyqueuosine(34) reductase QueG [Candidatus Acidoferrales bacterium]|nr:tRNA epoxyqueuosine(34) reductase QueG [Candidatus Acidoferrales bacterium]
MHHNVMLDAAITRRLCEQARAIGFDLCGVAPVAEFEELKRLPDWLARDFAGEMRYLHDLRRTSLEKALAGAHCVIVCAMNYNAPLPYSTSALEPVSSDEDARNNNGTAAANSPRGWISRYAWGNDYHDVLKCKLDELVAWMRGEFGGDFQARAYVDTGPVLERVAAKYAGLGWLAKNTCLINQQLGSWLFLGVILTDLDFAPTLAGDDVPPRDLCGTCTRCIDACPTDAFVEPYILDARRCISYLTIELRGPIPAEFRPEMGPMVFGCDICQDVCPWNRKAPATSLPEFQPLKIAPDELAIEDAEFSDEDSVSLFMPPMEWLLSLGENKFRRAFRGSPVRRAKWRGLLRNACVAAGNSRILPANPAYSRIMQRLEQLAGSADPLLAEHAQWALDSLRDNANADAQLTGGITKGAPPRRA